MAGKAGTVYIKADRNVEVAKTSVMIGDVLKIECTDPAMLARIRSIHLLTFHHPRCESDTNFSMWSSVCQDLFYNSQYFCNSCFVICPKKCRSVRCDQSPSF